MSQTRKYRASDLVTISCLVISSYLVIQLILLSVKDEFYSPSGHILQDRFASNGINEPEALDDKALLSISQDFLNLTSKSNEELLLVTQITGTGSSSLEGILKELKQDNHFVVIKNSPKMELTIHIHELRKQEEIALKMTSINETAAVFTPFAFINFSRFGLKQPTMVSLVRDPVERAISSFYHLRAPFHIVDRIKKFPELILPGSKYFKKSLEKCLNDFEDEECSYQIDEIRPGHTIELFCGHESFCRLFSNVEGLNKAKVNVESFFAVVGILEEWNKTLSVMEAFVPKFFSNATRIYYDKIHGDKVKMNVNKFKPSVDSWARKELGKRFFLEIEFYSFLRQRLHQQYLKVIKMTQQAKF